jgi:hypothetical protein
MEAPEKIYLVEDRQKHEPMEYWYNSTTNDSKIEYTRTDAFIEKAVKWINEHTSLSEKLVIENFRKYMEGD